MPEVRVAAIARLGLMKGDAEGALPMLREMQEMSVGGRRTRLDRAIDEIERAAAQRNY